MNTLSAWLELTYFRNTLLQWLTAVAVAVVTWIVLVALRRTARSSSARMQATPRTELLEIPMRVLAATKLPFLIALAIFAGTQVLEASPGATRVIQSVLTVALFWQAGTWAVAAAGAWLEHKRRHDEQRDRAALGSLGIIAFILNAVIWSLVVLLTLDNLGVDITALVAGLGIGGIAVALAVQNVLGDLFASLSITLDRPFVIGEFLVIGDFMGTVEYIGVKSTRIRSLNGEQIVMANSDLLGSRVRNYGRMTERRVVFSTGIAYETPVKLIEAVPSIIRDAIEAQSDVRFDRSHFQRHGAFSLDFETVYYVLSADYNRYMDIQQSINLRLHRQFAEQGIEFAYPTQKLMIALTQAQSTAT
jgi:small-conductance mechanosensitive channel